MKPTLPKIESGIPIPPRQTSKSKWRNIVLSLEPGQSFVIDTKKQQSMVLHAGKVNGVKMVTRKLNGTGFRCWRLT